MKTKAQLTLILVALLAYWSGLGNASAFYDPGTQRWLNRDPIGENEGDNLYTFTSNDSVDFSDSLGLELFIGSPVVEDPVLDPIIGPTPVIRPIVFNPPAPTPKPPISVPNPAPPVPPVLPPKAPCDANPHDDDCKKQWADAVQRCSEEFAKPHPDPVVTGGHKTINGCAKGYVTEDCGGNLTPPAPKLPRRIRIWRPGHYPEA